MSDYITSSDQELKLSHCFEPCAPFELEFSDSDEEDTRPEFTVGKEELKLGDCFDPFAFCEKKGAEFNIGGKGGEREEEEEDNLSEKALNEGVQNGINITVSKKI